MLKNSAKARQNFLPNRSELNRPKPAEPRTEPKFRSLPNAYSIGLKADYAIIGNPIRSAIQMLGDLAWVPCVGKVVKAYHIIKPTLSSDLAEFLQYFEEIWIGTPTSPARYRPSQWNQYKIILSVIYRSSNVVEGCHKGFYNLVECPHPSFHIFFEAMLNEQALTSIKTVAHLKLKI